MSQLILDDQLNAHTVLRPICRWITAERLGGLRPNELILDDRIPAILMTLRQTTFVTIDQDFWNPEWCNRNYGIICFALTDDEQEFLPYLLRALLRRPEFRTRNLRMGKVLRVSHTAIAYWEFRAHHLRRIAWRMERRRK